MREYGIRRDARYRLHGAEVLCEGGIVGVSRESIRLPNGHETAQDVIRLPDAVAIVPILEDGKGERHVVLVEQFRNSLKGHIHEIPAGVLEAGEAPEACARRELEEETGFRAGSVRAVASLLMIPGTSRYRMHFFVAEGLRPGEQKLEEAECLRVRRVPFEPLARSLVDEAPGATVVVDAKTHLGLLHTWLLLSRQGARSP